MLNRRKGVIMLTGESRSTVSLPGSSPRSPIFSGKLYRATAPSSVGDIVGNLRESAVPAGAVEDTPRGTDDRAAIVRQTAWEEAYDTWRSDTRWKIRPGTFKNYDRYVRKTLQWINKPTESITYRDLTAYRDNWEEEWVDTHDKPLHRGSINTWISAIRSFYDFCIKKLDMDIRNPAAKLDRPNHDIIERERKIRDPIPKDVYETMVAKAIQNQDHIWAVAARFAWQTLSRISDIHKLRWEDIDFDRELTTIRDPKAGPPKEKLLYGTLLDDLRWLREHHRADPEDFVFRRYPKEADSSFRAWFDRRLKKYAKTAGFEHYVHPHLIRASSATALSEQGVPTRDIMLQGGWESETSLKHYLREKTDARRDRLRDTLDL